jgi:predicted DsbA family dithiol-disulfide isomerase
VPTDPLAPPAPGTVVLWGDIACPWASLAVHRLLKARARLGLDNEVRIDHRAFALEMVNGRSTPKWIVEAEVAAIGAHEPALEWQPWQRGEHEYPSTVLIALAAVQAAKSDAVGGLTASEELDQALRRAFYVESRPISLWSEVIDVAGTCDAVDVDALVIEMRTGRGLAAVLDHVAAQEKANVDGSPHLFLPDGTDAHNPGLTVSWTKGTGHGFPVIQRDDSVVYDDLLRRAVQ